MVESNHLVENFCKHLNYMLSSDFSPAYLLSNLSFIDYAVWPATLLTWGGHYNYLTCKRKRSLGPFQTKAEWTKKEKKKSSCLNTFRYCWWRKWLNLPI